MKRRVLEGQIQGNENGYAFLIIEGENSDYFIPHSDLKGAMHGDKVLCETTDGVGNRTTARVLKVLERGIEKLVGTFFTCRNGGFVVPDEKKYYNDIFIPFGKGLRAKSGDKVVCKILSYPKKKNPEGIITNILGRQYNFNAELKSIMFTYNCPEKFSERVIKEADSLEEKIDFSNRKDLTNETVFTIDGEDAKDFDDAVSIEKTSDGNYKLGVHIADVSNYVKFNGEIDKEAYKRGTSIYFPEKVIPMLPEKLCNNICSLVEGKERLTLSCIMKVNSKGKVTDSEIVPSVIKSKARLTYTEVQRILEKDNEIIKKRKSIVKDILLMDELSDILIKRGEDKGTIDLDVKESYISVSKNGKISVDAVKSDKAHKIIEEFMILANVTVAEYMYFLEQPFIYRVHGKPTEERLEKFYEFIKGLGINVKRNKEEVFSKDFQKILLSVKDLPSYSLINRVMLRSMQKAKYSPENIGHFGLSEEYYCHFTSPIRRYPDLTIHRIIKDFLANEKNIVEKYSDFVVEASKQSSEKEKNAQEAERAVDDFYKIMYISNYVGENFNAIISGVTKFGIYCELENGIEGFIKLENIKGRNFKFDDKNYTLSNEKVKYRLGQEVNIKVVGIDLVNKKAEFIFFDNNNN